MKTKILLTFDYELYFGENYYNEDIVLFNPTNKLLKILKKNNVKAIFFIDICSIIGYKKNNKFDYIEKFKTQIESMKILGHDIQMHFHPHWFYSTYDNYLGKWIFDIDNYSYSNLIDNYGLSEANDLFLQAHNFFIEIVGYTPSVFRAGGYSVQPYEKELISLLKKLDYKIDTSVVPYRKYISKAQYFNFLVCEEKNFWSTSDISFLKTDISSLIEIPILSIKKSYNNIFYYALLRIINKFITNIDFDRRGKGTEMELIEYKNNALTIGFDMVSDKDKKIIKFITNRYLDKFHNEKQIYLNILSHPKAIFPESLDVLEWYINYMKKNYNSEFISFSEVQ